MNITYGYSKDERLDLKQFGYGLVVSKEGLPLVGTVNDGNISDKTWNLEVIREIQQGFLDPAELLYVADSALITQDNLEAMAQARLRFVSRFPDTYKLGTELKERAFRENTWQPIGRLAESVSGAVYQSRSYSATLWSSGAPAGPAVTHLFPPSLAISSKQGSCRPAKSSSAWRKPRRPRLS